MPLYETEDDLAEEDRISRFVADSYSLEQYRSVKNAKIDRVFHHKGDKRDRVAIAEIKRRRNSWKKYPTLMIDSAKVDFGIEMATKYDLQFWILVGFDHDYWEGMKIMRWVYEGQDLEKGTGGRKDREDPNDIDEVYWIPLTQFHPVFDRETQDWIDEYSRHSGV